MQKIKTLYTRIYKENLTKFIDFVGEPTGTFVRDHLLAIMAVVYIVCGFFVLNFPDSKVIVKMGYGDPVWNVTMVAIFWVGGAFMLIDWLFLVNKICWKHKGKKVTAEKCWILLKVFLWLLYLLFI